MNHVAQPSRLRVAAASRRQHERQGAAGIVLIYRHRCEAARSAAFTPLPRGSNPKSSPDAGSPGIFRR